MKEQQAAGKRRHAVRQAAAWRPAAVMCAASSMDYSKKTAWTLPGVHGPPALVCTLFKGQF